MNIIGRIKKLEQRIGANDKFCRCGTPFYFTFVIVGENPFTNVCPKCGRDVKARTPAKFVIESQKYNYEYEVIEPNVNECAIENV